MNISMQRLLGIGLFTRVKFKQEEFEMKRKIHNVVLMVLIYLNAFSLLFWISVIDAIISWQPYVIMAVNAGFLVLVGYTNGLFGEED